MISLDSRASEENKELNNAQTSINIQYSGQNINKHQKQFVKLNYNQVDRLSKNESGFILHSRNATNLSPMVSDNH